MFVAGRDDFGGKEVNRARALFAMVFRETVCHFGVTLVFDHLEEGALGHQQR